MLTFHHIVASEGSPDLVMYSGSRRPLPLIPDLAAGQQYNQQYYGYGYIPKSTADIYAVSSPIRPPDPFPHLPTRAAMPSQAPSALPGGTLLHKGFYDLLALIPSASSASRFLWGPNQPAEALDQGAEVAGPRYEHIPQSPTRPGPAQNPVSPKASPRKGRRISKDMVSKPMNFV